MKTRNVLFICQHNSARSQMAEAFLSTTYDGSYTAYSAGIEPGPINPVVVKVMKEKGIDISRNRSKSVKEFLDTDIDCVVTVCDQAKEMCPFFPGARVYIHKGFTDPSDITGPPAFVEQQVRKIRDEICEWVRETFEPDHFKGEMEKIK